MTGANHTGTALPNIGDIVLDGAVEATVTDVHDGVVWLHLHPGITEWPAEHPYDLTVIRTREEENARRTSNRSSFP